MAALKEAEGGEPARFYNLRCTSGTSGAPPVFFAGHINTMPFGWSLGSEEAMERVCVVMGGRMRRIGVLLRMMRDSEHDPRLKNASILFAQENDLRDRPMLQTIAAFDPHVVWGITGPVIRALTALRDEHLLLRSLRLVSTTGESMTQSVLDTLRELAPNASLEYFYASAELCAMSAPRTCPHLSLNQYHPLQGITFSIANADENGVGSVLVSGPLSKRIHLTDYDTGDSGILHEKPCACGASVTLELAGRANFDLVRAGGAIISLEMCDRVCRELSEWISQYRFLIHEEKRKNNLVWWLEMNIVTTKQLIGMPEGEEFIARKIEERLQIAPSRTLADLIRERFFQKSVAHFSPSIPERDKSIRLKKVYG